MVTSFPRKRESSPCSSKRELGSRPGLLTAGVTFFRGNDALAQEIDRTVGSLRALRVFAVCFSPNWRLVCTRNPGGSLTEPRKSFPAA